ncbi:Dynein light chain 1 axonemal [Fasciola gigantica]|uniref:Dynein axonemal light chain 1 n=1 Tax=Fasciola gigantica TaxID=46835 RepID=A0A504Z8Y3_FASGI|nr:Dynein light chain 1 axonemal [Fasciola gigantica]
MPFCLFYGTKAFDCHRYACITFDNGQTNYCKRGYKTLGNLESSVSSCLQEEKTGLKASEAKEVKLYAQYPPIEKTDASLSTLQACEKLSLSTNCIEKISNLNGLKNLKILSLGRNNIKNLTGLEAVGETLEQLWISYNLLEKLKGVSVLKKLKVLYMSNNLVKDWNEFHKLADLPNLEDLVFVGNPLEEAHPDNWREEACKRLPRLKKLDGVPVLHDDADED